MEIERKYIIRKKIRFFFYTFLKIYNYILYNICSRITYKFIVRI